ncbi:MAG TPA: alpha/beta fold hydrolase [Thermoanaerobaculia bacterium]|nr:alpha/beta fold hydrolase [Thermoanaerobaculia bacterium]
MIVDGLSYELAGSGDPVVFLHAGGLDARMWEAQVEAFARSHTVIRCDLRGSGKSAPPRAPFSASEDVVAVLRHLDIERAAIVGASLGGRTAIDLAIEHPQLVDKLVLVSAGLSGFEFSAQYQQDIIDVLGPLATGNEIGYVEAFLDSSLGPRSEEAQPLVARMLIDNQSLFTGGASFLQTPEPPALARLGAIIAPTLVVVGEYDHPDIRAIASLLARSIENAREVVISGAGHMANLDQADAFNAVVLDFLR